MTATKYVKDKDTREIRALSAELDAARADTARLDWLLARSHMSVHGNDERGWVICDRSTGLTIAARGKTAREAIDNAMKEKP